MRAQDKPGNKPPESQSGEETQRASRKGDLMKTHHRLSALALLLTLATLPTFAATSFAASPATPTTPTQPAIQIVTPADHAQLDAGESYPLEYRVALGPGDDHFHVWVDGERSPGIHDLQGTYRLPKMTAGEHVITLKLVDKGHVPTGPQTSIRVTVK
jgi:hypothetical protein